MKTTTKEILLATFIATPVLIFSCKKSDSTPQPDKPTITTNAITSITATTATSGGTIGDSSTTYTIIARGLRYSDSGDPAGSFPSQETNDLFATPGKWGSYPSYMTGLTPNTTYYVRAFLGYKVNATNFQFGLYGDLKTFKTAP